MALCILTVHISHLELLVVSPFGFKDWSQSFQFKGREGGERDSEGEGEGKGEGEGEGLLEREREREMRPEREREREDLDICGLRV